MIVIITVLSVFCVASLLIAKDSGGVMLSIIFLLLLIGVIIFQLTL